MSAIVGGSLAAAAVVGAVPRVHAQFATPLPDPASQDAAQFDMAVAIDTMCPNPAFRNNPESQSLRDTCDAVVNNTPGLDQEELNGVVQSLNGEEMQAAQQQLGEISDAQIDNLSTRLSAVRAGTGAGLSFAGLSIVNGERVLALGGPKDLQIVPAQFEESDFLSRLGIFVTGEVTFGDKDSSGEVEGYDFDTEGVTIGADWGFSDSLVVGAAVGYSRFNADFDESIDSPTDGQNLESDAVQFSLFGSYYPTDQLFVDGIASFGWHFYDSERRILVPSAADAATLIETSAKGDFDAIHYGFATNVGYTIRRFGANLTPIARLEYLRAEIDGFTEEEESQEAIELTFDDHNADSLTLNVGLEADYPISTGFGIIAPNIRAEYVHEFLGDEDGVLVRYAADPTQLSEFEVSREKDDEDYGILGAGVAATLQGGWAAFVDYHTFVGLDNFDIHTVNVGLRVEF